MEKEKAKEEIAIQVTDLCKRLKVPKKIDKPTLMQKLLSIFYRKWEKKQILFDVNFKVPKGEIIGYVGSNGAGKSTTVKLLTGVLTPTSGDVDVLGYSPTKERYEYTYNIGVVFGQRRLLWWNIPVIDSLKLYRDIYELSNEEFEERIEYFNKILKINDLLHIPYRKLSLGQQMRCEIAAALLHKPKIVFLDEPTIGLDVVAKEEVRNFLKEINKKEKTTIFLTTHDMEDIEELCKRIMIIDDGKIIYDGSLSYLKKHYIQSKLLEFEYLEVKNKQLFINTLKKTKIKEHKGNYYKLKIDIKNNVTKITKNILESCDVIDLNVREPRLRTIIAQIYKEKGIRKGLED